MGEVAAGLLKAKAAANAAGFHSGDTSDPGAQLMSDPLGGAPAMQASPLSALYPNMPDFSQAGTQQAQGGLPAMDAPQMEQSAPQAPETPQAAPVDTQPYDDNNYSTPQQIASSIGQGGNDDTIGVTGDGWKPKKETGIGRIMDTLLELRGRRPIFKDRTDDANLQSAMENAQGDEKPGIDQQKLISRIRKFNPDMADKMQNQLTTQTRLQGNLDRQNDVFDMKKEEIVRDRVASMMSAVKPTDVEGMKKMRQRVIAYGNNKGYDFSQELPEDMTGFDYDSFRLGQVKMKDQLKINETGRHHEVTEGQGASRITETGRHNQATEGQAATNEGGRNDRHDDTPRARSLMTKYGPGIISKDGTRMTVQRGGKTYGYVHTGQNDGKDNWTPVGEVELK